MADVSALQEIGSRLQQIAREWIAAGGTAPSELPKKTTFYEEYKAPILIASALTAGYLIWKLVESTGHTVKAFKGEGALPEGSL